MSLSLDLGCLKQLNCYSRTPNAKSRLHPVSYTWKNLASCYSKCLEFTIESCNFLLLYFTLSLSLSLSLSLCDLLSPFFILLSVSCLSHFSFSLIMQWCNNGGVGHMMEALWVVDCWWVMCWYGSGGVRCVFWWVL